MRKSAPLPGLLPVLRPCTTKHLKRGFNCLVQQFLSPRTDDTWAFFVPLLSRQRTSFLLTSYIAPTTLQRCPWSSRYRNRDSLEHPVWDPFVWRNRNTGGSKSVRGVSYCIRLTYRTQNTCQAFKHIKPPFGPCQELWVSDLSLWNPEFSHAVLR